MGEIEIIERNTVEEAEAEYFKRKSEGCWQMHKSMKIVWSWRRFKYVARFSMKKVERAYHIDDYLNDLAEASRVGAQAVMSIIKARKERNDANKR